MTTTRIKMTGDVHLSEELRSYVETKLSRLEKLIDASDTTNLFEVELQALPSKTPEPFRAEVNFSSHGKVMRMEATGETMHAAIDAVIDEGANRLRHLKTKRSDLIKKGGSTIKDFFRNLGG